MRTKANLTCHMKSTNLRSRGNLRLKEHSPKKKLVQMPMVNSSPSVTPSTWSFVKMTLFHTSFVASPTAEMILWGSCSWLKKPDFSKCVSRVCQTVKLNKYCNSISISNMTRYKIKMKIGSYSWTKSLLQKVHHRILPLTEEYRLKKHSL